MKKYKIYLTKITYTSGSIEVYADSTAEAFNLITQKASDGFLSREGSFDEYTKEREFEIGDIEETKLN